MKQRAEREEIRLLLQQLFKTGVEKKTRQEIIEVLQNIRSPGALKIFAWVLRSDLEEARSAVLSLLHGLGHREGHPLLAEMLGSPQQSIEQSVASALAYIGSLDDVWWLLLALKDKEPEVRAQACLALACIPLVYTAEGYENAILQTLADKHPAVRAAAALTVGHTLAGPRALEALAEALDDPVIGVRDSAAFALGRIGDPDAVPYLISLLHYDKFSVQVTACEALLNIGTEEAYQALHAWWHESANLLQTERRAARLLDRFSPKGDPQ